MGRAIVYNAGMLMRWSRWWGIRWWVRSEWPWPWWAHLDDDDLDDPMTMKTDGKLRRRWRKKFKRDGRGGSRIKKKKEEEGIRTDHGTQQCHHIQSANLCTHPPLSPAMAAQQWHPAMAASWTGGGGLWQWTQGHKCVYVYIYRCSDICDDFVWYLASLSVTEIQKSMRLCPFCSFVMLCSLRSFCVILRLIPDMNTAKAMNHEETCCGEHALWRYQH